MTVGYRCVGAFDIDPYAVQTYNSNFESRNAEIADLEHWRTLTLPRHVDVVLAGPPCQGFSTLGPRGPRDPRNRLLEVPVDIAISLGARLMLLENVPGALARSASRWKTVEARLRRNGYQCRTMRLDAGLAGLPQRRKRILLVARKGSQPIPDWAIAPSRTVPLGNVLKVRSGTANHVPRLLREGTRPFRIAVHIRPGQKLCNVRLSPACVHTWHIPEVFGAVLSRRRSLSRESASAPPAGTR